MKTGDIRNTFLNYFKSSGHEIVPSSSLVPRNDPTLLFTNAGMVPFKNVFTGLEKRPYTQATSSQKCLRAGGKHNDLENVGYTARHHTFFEMLGNFSFGDYFKEEAITLAWRLLTQEFGLDTDKLLVTHYMEDLETRALWQKIAGLPEHKIISISTKDNFWSMGATGPCGPCTEIFYDHGDHVAGGPPGSIDEDGDRFVEIWNLVFMQYDQQADGTRLNLPKPCVDTGMGLERMTAVMQGVFDNYDTDLMQALIEVSADYTSTDPSGVHSVSHRVISDHLRAMCFLIAEGILPSNEGRGYVLRRIMRRAMRHAHLTGYKGILMPKLVPALIAQMGQAYPELQRAEQLMVDTLEQEEGRFKRTLEKGLTLLATEQGHLMPGEKLSGQVAFKLYDTYGFPLDLTQDALRAEGIEVDEDGFHIEMQGQREAARAAWKGSGDEAYTQIWFDFLKTHGATEFIGYNIEIAEGEILAIVVDGASVQSISPGEEAFVITNQTPFYAESGGQLGDTGVWLKSGCQAFVSDTQKGAKNLHVHTLKIEEGTLSVGDTVEMRVDKLRRQEIRANHSATHLLHAALRKLFGEGVVQKGSLVAPDKLRFDFSFNQKLGDEDLLALENEVNREILANIQTSVKVMPHEDALLEGAMGLFGEKYDDDVRVVKIGLERFSVELCGGVHVGSTGEIGLFKIINESSVSAGIRRIEAVTGRGVLNYLKQQTQQLEDVSTLLKTTPEGIYEKVDALMGQRKKLEKEISILRQQGVGTSTDTMRHDLPHGGIFESRILVGVPVKDLRGMMDQQKQFIKSGVVLLLSDNEGKVSALLGVTKDLVATYPANQLIQHVAEALEAKGGGGRPDLAQCGGINAELMADAVDALVSSLITK